MGGAEQAERLSAAAAGVDRGPSASPYARGGAWESALQQSLEALWASGYEDRIIAELAVGSIARAVGVRAAVILGYDASNDGFELLAGIGAQESAVDALIAGPGRSVPVRAAREVRWQIVRGAVSAAAVPIEFEAGVSGVVMLFSAKPEVFSDEILCAAQDGVVVCGAPISRLMAERKREREAEALSAEEPGAAEPESAAPGLAERVDELVALLRERSEAADALVRRVAELEAEAREAEGIRAALERKGAAQASTDAHADEIRRLLEALATAEAAQARADDELSSLREELALLRDRNEETRAELEGERRGRAEILQAAESEAEIRAGERAEAERVRAECAEFRGECERLEGLLARESEAREELAGARARLAEELQARETAAAEQAARVTELESERDGLLRRVAEVVRNAEIEAARLGERIAELEAAREENAGAGESFGAVMEELESRMAEIVGDALEMESLRAVLRESRDEQARIEEEIAGVFAELAELRGAILEKALGQEAAAPVRRVAAPAPPEREVGSAGAAPAGDPFEGGFSDPELLEAFGMEARDCIRMTEVLIGSLEQQPNDPDLREAILRGFLTLESAAAAVGLKTLERQMHQGNRLLELAEFGALKMDAAVVRLLSRLNECAGALVDAALRREGGSAAAVADVGEEIEALCASLEATQTARQDVRGHGDEAGALGREKRRRAALRA